MTIEDLHSRAKPFFSRRFKGSMLSDSRKTVTWEDTGEHVGLCWHYVGIDFNEGIKKRGIAVEDLGAEEGHLHLIRGAVAAFEEDDKGFKVWMRNAGKRQEISTHDMPFSKRLVVYTNKLHIPAQALFEHFASIGLHLDVVTEEVLLRTVFISYGGPDARTATAVNNYLVANGVQTWFFPVDALPGQKLHRVMHEGVNRYDRCLLLCSKASLCRPGVLNELERVFEREAREGGTSILMPLALDDYVFSDWLPGRPDLADQVRSRVISRLTREIKLGAAHEELDRIIEALLVNSN